MSTQESGCFKFLCANCRASTPVFVHGEFHIYCVHNRLTVIQGQGRNVVRYDSNVRKASAQRPKFDGTDGFFKRVMNNES